MTKVKMGDNVELRIKKAGSSVTFSINKQIKTKPNNNH